MPEILAKWVVNLVPFLAPYPGWVKVAFSVFVMSGAVWFIGLVVAAPETSTKKPAAEQTSWLTIRGVTAFGRGDGQGVKVTATINGTQYVYPSLSGVEWLEIGPEMAPQAFQIPVRENYTVRFSAQLRDGPQLVSVEEHRISGETDGVKTYAVRELDRGQRSARVAAEVRYAITQNNP